MIDTLMALWNRDRRKRGSKLLMIFLLLCISISLLLCVLHVPSDSRQQSRKTATDGVAPTATLYQSTIGPNMTPTSTFVIVNQATPTVTTSATPTLAAGTPSAATPVATATMQPCITTPASGVRKGSAIHTDAPVRQGNGGHANRPTVTAIHPRLTPTPIIKVTKPTPTKPRPVLRMTVTPAPTRPVVPSPTAGPTMRPTPSPPVPTKNTPTPAATAMATPTSGTTGTVVARPGVSVHPQDGGGPIITSSPVPTPTSTSSPGAGQNAATPNTPYNGGGSSCIGNNIGGATSDDIVETLEHNLGLILGSSLFGTMAFYGAAYVVRRKKRV